MYVPDIQAGVPPAVKVSEAEPELMLTGSLNTAVPVGFVTVMATLVPERD